MTAHDHPNAARARAYLEAYAAADLDAISLFFAEDIVWRVGGTHPLSGTYHGPAAVLEYLRRAQAQTGGSLTLDASSVLASDRHLAMFLRVQGTRGGASLDTEMAQVVLLAEDGSWTEFWALSNDQPAVDAFWSAAA